MKTTFGFITTLIVLMISFICHGAASSTVTIIKDGGGTEFIENSLITIALGVTGGADYLELPVNVTSDDQLIVFRDITLNRLTDVQQVFPGRNREDGNYYVVDFSMQELRQLRLRKVFEDDIRGLSLGIASLQEALTVVIALNTRYTKNTGVVINLVNPPFYQGEGKAPGQQLKSILDLLSFGPENKIYIQSSDPDELQKISRWPSNNGEKKYPLIQEIEQQPAKEDLLGNSIRNIQHSWLLSNSGRRILASYADAVALPGELLQTDNPDIQNFIHSLQSFDIKIFAIKTGEKPLFQEKEITVLVERKDGNLLPPRSLDGIYVDSLQNSDPGQSSTENTFPSEQQTGEASSLPPFFSNLGLSGPKPTSSVHDFREEENAEELE